MVKSIKETINQLEEYLKIPFLLHYAGYTHQEISNQLALPLGIVESRILLARKKLKQSITTRYDGLETLKKAS